MNKLLIIGAISILLLSGCNEKKEEESKAPGMKCGAGKCGANMFDGNSALAKKKKNILAQMREDDKRKDCVIAAKTTKEAYDCVRDSSGKLSLKCGGDTQKIKEPTMKCGAGKCGDSMKEPKKEVKKEVKKEEVMKCGAGKCGS